MFEEIGSQIWFFLNGEQKIIIYIFLYIIIFLVIRLSNERNIQTLNQKVKTTQQSILNEVEKKFLDIYVQRMNQENKTMLDNFEKKFLDMRKEYIQKLNQEMNKVDKRFIDVIKEIDDIILEKKSNLIVIQKIKEDILTIRKEIDITNIILEPVTCYFAQHTNTMLEPVTYFGQRIKYERFKVPHQCSVCKKNNATYNIYYEKFQPPTHCNKCKTSGMILRTGTDDLTRYLKRCYDCVEIVGRTFCKDSTKRYIGQNIYKYIDEEEIKKYPEYEVYEKKKNETIYAKKIPIGMPGNFMNKKWLYFLKSLNVIDRLD